MTLTREYTLPARAYIPVRAIPDELKRLRAELDRHAWLFCWTRKQIRDLEERIDDPF